jgi:hypothetical protein
MLNETLKITGDVQITVFDETTGVVKDQRQIKNLVVAAGKTFIAASILKTTSNSPAAMTHMAVGTNSTAPADANTALGAENGRVALASATSSSNVVTYTATFPAGTGTGALVEAGIFNASSAGTMLCRTTFAVVTKGAADAMSITWTVTVS